MAYRLCDGLLVVLLNVKLHPIIASWCKETKLNWQSQGLQSKEDMKRFPVANLQQIWDVIMAITCHIFPEARPCQIASAVVICHVAYYLALV
jgi:hypothetical protein